MRVNKEFEFFTYLIESYSIYKDVETKEVMRILDEKDLTDFVYNMYELYHIESIENAFKDIDSLISTGETAW